MAAGVLSLASVGIVPGLAVLTAPPAHASCAAPEYWIDESQAVFSGHIIDGRGEHVLMQVDRVRPGDHVLEQVWLLVRAEGMLASAERFGEFGDTVPTGYSDPRRLTVAISADDRDWSITACNAWHEYPEDPPDPHGILSTLTAAPVRGVAAVPPPMPSQAESTSGSEGLAGRTKVVAGAGGVGLGAVLLGASLWGGAMGGRVSPWQARRRT